MRSLRPARRTVLGAVVGLSIVATAAATVSAGSEDTAPDGTATASTVEETPGTLSPEGEDALAALVAAAQEEGTVTIYSSQGLDQLDAMASAFTELYDIEVEVVRGNDADAIPRIETELSTGTSGGDLVITASQNFMETQAQAGSWVDPSASPRIGGLGGYDAETYVHEGHYFEVGGAVLTFAWNTDDLPEGLSDYPDLLDPDLGGGRIAVIDPAISPVLVDFYLWLEDSFGEDYVTRLAEQQPRIYPSALPIGEALTSGEVSAAIYASPTQLLAAAENGAPVDYGVSPAGAWGARFYGAIPTSSDHPNAAVLLADFMVSPEGQTLVQPYGGTVQPGLPTSLITNDRMRVVDVEATAPEPAAAFVEEWNSLFR